MKSLFYLSMVLLMAFTSCQTTTTDTSDVTATSETSNNNDSIKYAILIQNDRIADYCWSLQIPNDEKESVEILTVGGELLKEFDDYSYYSCEVRGSEMAFPLLSWLGKGGWELICIEQENFTDNYKKYYFKKGK